MPLLIYVGVSTRADAALRPALRPIPLLQEGSKHRTFPQKATKATKEEWLNRSKGRLRTELSRTGSEGNKCAAAKDAQEGVASIRVVAHFDSFNMRSVQTSRF